MLTTLFILPILGALVVATMQDKTAVDLSRIKKATLFTTLVTFVLSMVV